MASESELKRLLTLLRQDARETARLAAELERSRQELATARVQLRELSSSETSARKTATELRRGLAEVLAVDHGKRQDRRLSRAQRVASRALTRAEKPAAKDGSGAARPGPARRIME